MGKTSRRRSSVKNEIFDYSEDHFEQGSQIAEKLQTSEDYEGLKISNHINDIQIDSDEEEAYLLLLPKGVHTKDLENSKFSIDKESKIKIKSEKYKVGNPLPVQKSQYFIKSGGLKKITPISTLIVGKKVDLVSDDSLSEEGKVKSVAENLTEKHTMFGPKYEDRINLQEEIEKKIQEALQRVEKKELKMKKKKKAEVENDKSEEKSLLISKILEEKLKSKKLQRAENKPKDPNESETQNFGTSDKDSSKKKKQKKNCVLENSIAQPIKTEIIFHDNFKFKSINSMESKFGTVGIEESSTEKSPIKKKKHKSIANSDSSNQEIGCGSEEYNNGQLKDTLKVYNDESNAEKKDKKKKKHKSTQKLDSSSQGSCETEEHNYEQLENTPIIDDDESYIKKKTEKKNKKRITNLELNEHQNDTSKINDESNTEKTVKKKKKKNKVISDYSDQRISNTEENTIDIEIKKELLSDVDMVDSSFSSSVNKKNKKEKRKHSEVNEVTVRIQGENEEESSSQVVTVSKKRKRNYENSSIEIKNEILSENEDTHIKKKKKKRRDSEFVFPAPENIKQEIDDSDMSIRTKSLLSSTLIKESSPDFKTNISVIPNENSGKKKKKSNNLIQSLLETVKQNLDNPLSPKKKLSL